MLKSYSELDALFSPLENLVNVYLAGLYVVTAGELTTEIEITTGTDAERTHFAFGIPDKWGVFARVTGIHPRSDKVEITVLIGDNRVHQN